MDNTKNTVLKLSTSGSVDDGKSTLIGRILYDTKSLKDDKLAAIKRSSEKRGYDYLDFSLATDGLVAEREQGITIDVAHIYFSTPNRSYIIADTPGHIEYTRNMVTGTSTSQVAIVLIDARNGVIEQTKRHFYITSLLQTKEIIVVINKMDLVDYDETRYQQIVKEFKTLQQSTDFNGQNITYIPVSALHGDNVVYASDKLGWYNGRTLMDCLENIQVEDTQQDAQARFQIQTVIRPKKEEYRDFRGYAGKLKGNDLKVGDEVVILPSQQKTKIKEISFFGQSFYSASNGSSLTLILEDDINVSRGDWIVKANEIPKKSKLIKAKICWMDHTPLSNSSMFQLQHGVHKVKSKVKSILSKVDINNTNDTINIDKLKMNDIGEVEIQLAKPLFFNSYKENKANGTFILIDPKTNMTSAVGFIL